MTIDDENAVAGQRENDHVYSRYRNSLNIKEVSQLRPCNGGWS
ncbi:hypothetical protein OX462_25650 [Janthinobacterium sp. SUN098]|nr:MULTISPECIES: hypothetical protein [Janthinobacterium]